MLISPIDSTARYKISKIASKRYRDLSQVFGIVALTMLGIAVVTGSAGCRTADTSHLSPAGKTAYTADQIAARVLELEQATIAAESQGIVKTSDARQVVTWCVNAAKILQTTPNGWQSTLVTSWSVVSPLLPASNPAVAAAANLVNIALASLVHP